MERKNSLNVFKLRVCDLIDKLKVRQNICIAKPIDNNKQFEYVMYISKEIVEYVMTKNKKKVSLKINFVNSEFTVNNKLASMDFLKDFMNEFNIVLNDVKNGSALFYESQKRI